MWSVVDVQYFNLMSKFSHLGQWEQAQVLLRILEFHKFEIASDPCVWGLAAEHGCGPHILRNGIGLSLCSILCGTGSARVHPASSSSLCRSLHLCSPTGPGILAKVACGPDPWWSPTAPAILATIVCCSQDYQSSSKVGLRDWPDNQLLALWVGIQRPSSPWQYSNPLLQCRL